MAEVSPELKSKLAQLSPEARERVEAALKTTIDAELAAEPGGPGTQGQFSRGIIFSRVTRAHPDEKFINEALQMDEAKFTAFADRLAKLKNVKGG